MDTDAMPAELWEQMGDLEALLKPRIAPKTREEVLLQDVAAILDKDSCKTWTQIFAELVEQGKPTGFVRTLAHGEWYEGDSPYAQMVLTRSAMADVREWLRNFYPPTEEPAPET